MNDAARSTILSSLRTPHSAIFAVALIAAGLSAYGQTGQPAPRPPAKPPLISPFKGAPGGERPISTNEIEALELSNAEVPDVLKVISDVSGWTIIPSSKLTGKVSFFAKDTTCKELFDGLVKANDWVAVKEGNVIVVLTREEYTEQYGPVRQVTRVFQVSVEPSADMAALIKPLLSKEGQVVADKLSGRVAVRDTQQRVAEVEAAVAKLQEGVLTEVFQLQYASANDVIETIRPLVSIAANLTYDARTNQIVVTDNSLNVQCIRQTLERLDQEDVCFTRTFRLQHADCVEVQNTLLAALGRPTTANQVSTTAAAGQVVTPQPATPGQAAPAPVSPNAAPGGTPSAAPSTPTPAPVAPAPQSRVQAAVAAESNNALASSSTIAADPRINAVIVTDTPAMLRRIEGLIKDLDAEEILYAYTLKYADPTKINLTDKLKTFLNTQYEHFAVDPVSKAVTFSASAGKAKQLLALLKQWDRQPPQIFLEAKVISIDCQNGFEVGTEFDSLLNQLHNPAVQLVTSFPGNSTTTPGSQSTPGSMIQIGSLSTNNYQALLHLIETKSKTKLLSNPKVIASDGNQAMFQVATQEPYTEVTTATQGTTLMQNVQFIPVGVTLTLTPNITDDGCISMDVDLQVSSLVNFVNNIPVVSKSEAKSHVLIAQNHTLIIGGLISDSLTDATTGVPLIQHIPILGWLFRDTQQSHDKSELVLFITPRAAPVDAEDKPPTETEPD
jgi:type II secretory pathway component GspD/PulD (secretin)